MIDGLYLERLRRLADAGGRRILGLVGAPGAGKSTLAEAILDALPDQAVVVPMDGYHLANVELQRLGRAGRKGAEDTFDSAGYVALLRRLREQRPDEIVYAPAFRREIEEPIAGAIPVLPDVPLIVTEGNYLLLEHGHWRGVKPLLDEVWFVNVDQNLRRSRLLARHVSFGRSEEAAEQWVSQTDDVNARLIDSTRLRADVQFNWPAAG
ncbi:nucleoside/nucleotide kinase family protein [Caballeronia sp. LZ034LL]|uniref:nucleoside/nucleotide kinase family protein n=1 Tax=Caballeronia sp. LZ034LL TaxID=3038567 RepID=UPI00285FC96A|nr:nucleoside/nucleotide kinase family protein [Caballeronia sp. LZ034LL]MDR5837254.1 nucleoside/nucleotide kinase family protein [Caballeronia sp. LZ034LL]